MTAAVANPKATGTTTIRFTLHLSTMTPDSYRSLYYLRLFTLSVVVPVISANFCFQQT